MGRVKQEDPYYDVKSQLVIETCKIYKNSHFSCIHNDESTNLTNKSPFIDWYLILRIREDASINTIRKQYHKLALLLHPDKNKHPQAEFSFKLISQAYKCLSDNSRRNSFNLERWKNHCTQCNTKIPHTTDSHSHSHSHSPAHCPTSTCHTKFSRSYKILDDFKVIKEQLKEEANVIESCIRVNRVPKKEYPVFDPSSYSHLGYPHKRNQRHVYYKKGASFGGVQYDQRKGRCETPIFELRTDYSPLNINSACLSS